MVSEGELPIFVAFDKNKMVGYAVVEAITFGVAYLGWIAVLREYQRRNIGKKLLETVEKWCKANDIHKIELEAQIKDLLPFFEKIGFELEGVRKNSWQRLDNYMFGKSLS